MKEKLFNIPNILTYVRILLIPIVVIHIFNDHMVWAFVVFIIACLTDLLDGYIARKYDQITEIGMLLDPLADKLMAITIVICFTIKGILPLYIVLIIIVKEGLMLLGGTLLAKKKVVIPSNIFGKIAAFALNASIAAAFFHEYWQPYDLYAIYASLILVIIAFIQYAVPNVKKIFDKEISE